MVGSTTEYAAGSVPAGAQTSADLASESDAVFDQLAATASLVDSAGSEDGHHANHSARTADSRSGSGPAVAGGGQHDEESVENYMSALLSRYGLNSSEPQVPRAASVPANAAQSASSIRGAGATAARASGTGGPTEDKPVTNRQPVSAPEDRDGLSAMRELAMMSAHGALATHSSKRLVQLMYGKLAIAAVAIVSSIALVAMTTTVGGWTYAGAIVMLLLAAFWTWQYLASAQQLLQKTAVARVSPERSMLDDELEPSPTSQPAV
jgi:hypothetical protein